MAIVRRLAPSLGLTLGGLVLGAAASLALSSGTLGAATTSTPRCTTAGLSVIQNLSGSTVISVTVGNIPAACGGAVLQAALNNGTTNATGSVTVAAGGGSATVVLGTAPARQLADEVDLVFVGP